MNKVVYRFIRIHDAKAYEKMLNEYAEKGYQLQNSYGPLIVFVRSEERLYYQVVKNPQKNKEKYIEFCEEFDVEKVATIAFGCLHIFASTKPYELSLDEQIDPKAYKKTEMMHLIKMIGMYLFLFISIVLMNMIVSNNYSSLLLYISGVIKLIYIYGLIFTFTALFDVGKTIYYMINQKKTTAFIFNNSFYAIILVMAYCSVIVWFTNHFITFLASIGLLIAVGRLYLGESKKKSEFVLTLTITLLLNAFGSLTDLARVYHLKELNTINANQQSIVQVLNENGQWQQYETENEYVIYGEVHEVRVNDMRTQMYQYIEVKEGKHKQRILNLIEESLSAGGLIYPYGDYFIGISVESPQQIIKVDNQYYIFLVTTSETKIEAIKTILMDS